MIFKINDERYYPGKDNIVRIALSNEGTNITQTLTIITKEDNVTLKEGTYYLKISNYASYDGYLYEELITSEISIPILVMKITLIFHIVLMLLWIILIVLLKNGRK